MSAISQFGFTPKPLSVAAGSHPAGLRSDVQYVAPMNLLTVTMEDTDADVTHLAEEILGGMILRTTGAPRSDTFPTAELLLAAYKGAVVGSAVRVIIRNYGGSTVSMLAGVGMTNYAGNTLDILTVNSAEYMIVFTNVTPGAAACTLYVLSSANVH
jgi:hypothetical protein